MRRKKQPPEPRYSLYGGPLDGLPIKGPKGEVPPLGTTILSCNPGSSVPRVVEYCYDGEAFRFSRYVPEEEWGEH